MSDYISREAAISAIVSGPPEAHWPEHYASILEELPAADVAPVVHEKWLLDRWPSWPHRECSRCKIMFPRTTEVADQYWQYCPNCGARMDGAAE